MGIFDGGLAVAEGLRAFGGAVSNVGLADEVHALWDGVRAGGAPGSRCALCGLVRRHIRRGEGTAVWFDYWSVRSMHPRNFESCHHEHGYKLGLEITASTAIGWVLAGLVIGLVYKPRAPLTDRSR